VISELQLSAFIQYLVRRVDQQVAGPPAARVCAALPRCGGAKNTPGASSSRETPFLFRFCEVEVAISAAKDGERHMEGA